MHHYCRHSRLHFLPSSSSSSSSPLPPHTKENKKQKIIMNCTERNKKEEKNDDEQQLGQILVLFSSLASFCRLNTKSFSSLLSFFLRQCSAPSRVERRERDQKKKIVATTTTTRRPFLPKFITINIELNDIDRTTINTNGCLSKCHV